MGKEAREKCFVKIILDVGHKRVAKWDEKMSKEAVSEPCIQPLHQEWLPERYLVKIIADVGHEMEPVGRPGQT